MFLEFLIRRKPLSLQAKGSSLSRWKQDIRREALRSWSDEPYDAYGVHLTIVYFCGDKPVDTDNIIKPIQDALDDLVYTSDKYITDVDSHRRPFIGEYDVTKWPPLLVRALYWQTECLYVRVKLSDSLEEHL